jgi:tetratricopeptide (TPR) repeat protein
MIGRDAQIAEAIRFIEAAVEGRGEANVLFVTGEAGIGKSTLLHTLRTQLSTHHPSTATAIAACSTPIADREIGGVEALDPWARMVTQLLGEAARPSSWRSIVGELAMAWVRVIPVIGDVLESMLDTAQIVRRHSGAGALVAGQQQMFQQMINVLSRLSSSAPLVLMLDDAHWADASSMNLLFAAARQLRGRPVAFITAYRADDAAVYGSGQGHSILRVRGELERYGLAAELELAPLDRDDLGELVASRYAGHHRDSRFEAWLVELSGGNPLFIEQFLAMLEEDHRIDRETGAVADGYEHAGMPASARAVIDERIRRLGDEAREPLRYASVEGATFTLDMLVRVTGTPALHVARTLRQVETTHSLVRPLGEVAVYTRPVEAWRFSSVLVHKALYDGLGRAERIMIHREVLAALVEAWQPAHSGDPSAIGIAARIAAHAEVVGDHRLAATALLDGARASWRSFAEDETLGMIAASLAALDRLVTESGVEDIATRFELLVLRSEVDRVRGRLAPALEGLVAALEIGGDGDRSRAMRVRTLMAEILKVLHRFEEAANAVSLALADAEALDDAKGMADARLTSGNIHLDQGRTERALEQYRLSLQAAERAGLTDRAAKALANIGQASRRLGRYDDARISYERSGELSLSIGDRRARAILLNNMGALALRTGRLEEARRCFEESGAIFDATGDIRLATMSRANVGELALAQGDAATALEQFAIALESARSIDDRSLMSATLRDFGHVLCELDRPTEARAYLDEARDELDGASDPPSLAEWNLLAVRIALAVGDLVGARAAFAECARLAGSIADVELAAAVEGWRGMLIAAEARAADPGLRLALMREASDALDRCIASLEPLEHHELGRWRGRRAGIAIERDSLEREPTPAVGERNDDRT